MQMVKQLRYFLKRDEVSTFFSHSELNVLLIQAEVNENSEDEENEPPFSGFSPLSKTKDLDQDDKATMICPNHSNGSTSGIVIVSFRCKLLNISHFYK